MGKIEKYYWISPKSSGKRGSIACAPEGTTLGHRLINQVKDLDRLPFSFSLYEYVVKKNLIIDKGKKIDVVLDYQANSLAWPLMSKKMKEIICNGLFGTEKIRWIEAEIIGATEVYSYYIPVFECFMDTLNKGQSLFQGFLNKTLVKGYYNAEKVKAYGMFHGYSDFWQITRGLYVRKRIMEDLRKERISGIYYSTEALLC